LIAGTAGGTKRRRESKNRRQPSQRVKPEAKAAEGSLVAPEIAKADASRRLLKLADPEGARTGGYGILIDGFAGDARFG
jgi:hypothetical protein